MSNISIISPIKTPEDIITFANDTSCRSFYVYHHKFLNNNFEYIKEFINKAHDNNSKIYVNFKHNVSEEELPEIKRFISYLKTTNVDGIFVNTYSILEVIKTQALPFKVIADSYFDLHNTSGIEFIKNFHKVDMLIVTEEIYLKNIVKLKQYTNLPLAIDSDNLPWCAEDIKKLKAIDAVVIKGKFFSSEEILDGIKLIEKIIAKPKMFKEQKLPFKHIRKSLYQTNHFSGEIISAHGQDFKFSRYIQNFEWQVKRSNLKKDFDYKTLKIPRINIRLTSLAQLKQLKTFIDKIGFNLIYSLEFGEILNTADLSISSFDEITKKVKNFCRKNNIIFQLSTPKILIERDFDRVYEHVKRLCLEEPLPNSIIVNNIGYFWAFVNDTDLQRFPIEIGQGLNLLNSMSISCLNNLRQIDTVDFTPFKDVDNLKKCLKKLKNIIPNTKLTVAGCIRVPSLGLCPLNNDSAIISRLSCKAPCHRGNYALKDPSLNKIYPFIVDGFCRMHMFEDEILDKFDYISRLQQIGINEFVIDFSSLPASFVPKLLTNLLNSLLKQNILDAAGLSEDIDKFFDYIRA